MTHLLWGRFSRFIFGTFAILLTIAHSSASPSYHTRKICLGNGEYCSTTEEAPQNETQMIYQHLGRSGLLVSRLSYGSYVTFGNQIDEEQAFQIMKLCYENGINTFDNAEAYANGEAESMMGRVLQRFWKDTNLDVTRDDLVITTKIFFGTYRPKTRPNRKGLSRKHIIAGLKASLSRLQLDFVDVVFAHRMDPYTPMEEIVRAFNYVINQGMAHYWCTSEWNADDIRYAHAIAKDLNLVGPICEQPQYNLFKRERVEIEYAPLYRDFGLGTTIWASLAMGVLTGKYNNGIPEGTRLSISQFLGFRDSLGNWDDVVAKVINLQAIADELNCSMAQLSIAWCLLNPHISSVILGGTKLNQLRDNLGALRCLKRLSEDKIDNIERVMQTKPGQPIDWTKY